MFALLMLIAVLAAWPVWTGLAMQWFHAGEAQLGAVVLQFFTEIRFYFLFVLLAPALALHWTMDNERARAAFRPLDVHRRRAAVSNPAV